MVKSCSLLSCLGCSKELKPVLFNVHVQKCKKVKEVTDEDTHRLSIKVTSKEADRCNAIVTVANMRWLSKFSFEEFSTRLLPDLKTDYSKAEVFQGKVFSKFEKAQEREQVLSIQELIEEMQMLQVVSQDRRFRDFFQISSHLEAEPEEAQKFSAEQLSCRRL